jgi:hypothetical protein
VAAPSAAPPTAVEAAQLEAPGPSSRPRRAAAAAGAAKAAALAAAEAAGEGSKGSLQAVASAPAPALAAGTKKGTKRKRVPEAAAPVGHHFIKWSPYLTFLVNVVWFFQELYGGLGCCSSEAGEATNSENKQRELRGVPKGGPSASRSSEIKLRHRVLVTHQDAKEQYQRLCRPRKQRVEKAAAA